MSYQSFYQKAMDFAANAHGDQKVPGKQYSYVVHLAEVAMEVMASHTEGCKYNIGLTVQCALLHDTIEDSEVSYQEVEETFGIEVAAGVLALSKDKNLDKGLQLEDSLQRIVKQPKEIWMVKMADRITNLQKPPIHWTKEKMLNYQKEAVLIYDQLKDANQLLAVRLAEQIQSYTNYIDSMNG
jgi:(p)ppGpp synthase/HD superfamily hydrolase